MVNLKQGDIIKLDFNPQSGHEQAEYRPTLVVSNEVFHQKTNLVIVCPISNTSNNFPLHVKLDNRTANTVSVLCQRIKSLDIASISFLIDLSSILSLTKRVSFFFKINNNFLTHIFLILPNSLLVHHLKHKYHIRTLQKNRYFPYREL